MKKAILLPLLCCILFVFAAKAQDAPEKPRSYISISSGISIPFGDFKKADYGALGSENNKAGFAKKGIVYDFEGGWYLNKHWGIAVNLQYQDQGRLTTNDATNISDGYRIAYGAYTSTVTASKRYSSISLMIGPQYNFAYKAFIFDIRAVAGAIKSLTSPLIVTTVNNYENVNIQTFSQYSSKATAFGFGGSAAVTFKMSEGVGLVLRENVLDAPTGFKISNSTRTIDKGRTVTNQPFQVFQTTLGLRFAL